MLELIPIVIPQISWANYLSAANNVLGESISQSFDAAKIPTGPRSFVISLNDLTETSPALDIDVAGLKHLSYTFLGVVLEGAYTEIFETSRLHFTSNHSSRPGLRLVVVSGNLLEWKEAVVFCSCSNNPDVNTFGTKAKNFFEEIGLSDLWKHYLRIKLPNQSIKLLPKA